MTGYPRPRLAERCPAARSQKGKSPDANDDRDDGARRCGKAHREQRVRVPDGRQVDERDARRHDGDDIVQERDFRAAAGAEIATETEVDAREDAVKDIALQVRAARHDDSRVIREQPDNAVRRVLRDDGDHDAEAHRHRQRIAKRLLRAADLARTDVLRAERRDRREHRRRHEEDKADDLLDDADRRRVRQPAHVRDDRDDEERHLDEAVLQRDWHTDAQDAAQHREVRTEILPRKRNARPAALHIGEREHDTDGLRDDRAPGRAGRPHGERPHEKIVERDIAEAGHRDKVHRTLRIAEPTKDRGDDVVGRDERDAEEADQKIRLRPRCRLKRRLHDTRNRAAKHDQHNGQHDGDHKEQHRRRADGLADPQPVLRANRLRNRDRRPHRQPYDHDGQHVHDLTANRYRRDASRPLKLPDDKEVRHAVERLQEIRKKKRQREIQDIPRHTARCQILTQQKSLLDTIVNTTTMVESRGICACRQRCSEAEPLLATIYKRPQPLIDNTTNDS